ncbi:MAG: CoA transferase, partial [Chloroflexi bacterium]|nr:CoA transferase [Chloroflexota bacterium]
MHTLQAAGVTAAAVYTNRDIVEDPHLKERGYFQEIPHPRTGPTLFSGVPVLLSKTPGALRIHAPMMGEHNDFLLRDLVGLGEEEVSGLKAQKAIVTHPPETHVGPPY